MAVRPDVCPERGSQLMEQIILSSQISPLAIATKTTPRSRRITVLCVLAERLARVMPTTLVRDRLLPRSTQNCALSASNSAPIERFRGVSEINRCTSSLHAPGKWLLPPHLLYVTAVSTGIRLVELRTPRTAVRLSFPKKVFNLAILPPRSN